MHLDFIMSDLDEMVACGLSSAITISLKRPACFVQKSFSDSSCGREVTTNRTFSGSSGQFVSQVRMLSDAE